MIACKLLYYMQIQRNYNILFDGGWSPTAVREAILAARHIVLVAHMHADGDAVGSLTGMYALLSEVTGTLSDQVTDRPIHSVTITPLLPDGCPDDLMWLPNTNAIICGKDDKCKQLIEDADLVIALDLNSIDRTGILADPLRASQAKRMVVDHHIGPDSTSFDIVVSEPEISSTCELVYWLMSSTFGSDIFNLEAATSLFAGMCTDTGTFSYSNTQQSLYLAAADLLTYGVDPMDINRCIKNVFTVPRLRFFGHAMAERLTVYLEPQIALMVLTAKEIAEYGVDSADLTGLINEVMKLRDIDCGILVREEEGRIRLSFRSKSRYDVNQLAGDLFDGGGHARAAGATSLHSLDETVRIIKNTLHLEDR